QVLTGADDRYLARAQGGNQTWHGEPVTRPVDPARADDGPVPLVAAHQVLRQQLRTWVVVPEHEAAERRLLGDGPRAGRPTVNGDRADMQEPADLRAAASGKHVLRGRDALLLELLPGSPIADARGAVIDNVDAGEGVRRNLAAQQVAFDQL